MSKKIPFLQMFALLGSFTELANAVQRWFVVSAAIDKTSRSAKIQIEGASGAGGNLLDQAEQKVNLLLADGREVPFEGEEDDGI